MAEKQSKGAELIRIAGTDINTQATLLYGLTRIKGINYMLSNALCKVLSFDKNARISTLTEKDIEKLENYLNNPNMEGIPKWMLNQRKELTTGSDLHYVSKDIEYNLLQFKRRLAKLKSYRGIRHKLNLPLRGQRTHSNFRRNKTIAAMKSKKERK